MKKTIISVFSLALALVIFSACNNGPKPVEIQGLDKIVESNYKYEISIPSNWQNTKNMKRVASFSNKEASDRFRKYEGEGFPGAKVDLEVVTLDSSGIDGLISKRKVFAAEVYSAPSKTKIDGVDATKLTYTFDLNDGSTKIDGVDATKLTYTFDLNDGSFDGEMYAATKDNKTATLIIFETFGATKEKYKEKFEEILKSVKLAITPVRKEGDLLVNNVEAPPASKNLKITSGTGFSISVPDNFKTESGGAKAIFSKRYIGERRGDCYVQVDVIDSKKSNNLKNIADGTKSAVKGSELKETKLSGLSGYFFTYTPAKDINGRIYFALKNDKLYRMTINWFKGEETDYLPVFENVIKSLNIK